MRILGLLLVAGLMAAIVQPLAASTVEEYGYFKTNHILYYWDQSAGFGSLVVTPTASGQAIDDIAFDTDGQLYGVGFNAPVTGNITGGGFWKINTTTGVATLLATNFGASPAGDISNAVNALTNYSTNKFYAAVDGGSADVGHLYNWTWNGSTLTGTDVGAFHDSNAEAGFGGTTAFSSIGDLWYQNSTLYATITGGSKFFLVTVDPSTAEVTFLANLGNASLESEIPALTQYNGFVGLIDFNSRVYYWNGTSIVDTLTYMSGSNLSSSGGAIRGGTAMANGPEFGPGQVPEPVTMAGLLLGLGGVANYIRRRRLA